MSHFKQICFMIPRTNSFVHNCVKYRNRATVGILNLGKADDLT